MINIPDTYLLKILRWAIALQQKTSEKEKLDVIYCLWQGSRRGLLSMNNTRKEEE